MNDWQQAERTIGSKGNGDNTRQETKTYVLHVPPRIQSLDSYKISTEVLINYYPSHLLPPRVGEKSSPIGNGEKESQAVETNLTHIPP